MLSLVRQIRREAVHNPLVTLAVVASVAIGAGAVVTAVVLFEVYDRATAEVLMRKESEVKTRMDEMWDEYRRITLGLGFNVLILPEEQSLADFYIDGGATEYMPEEYAARLAESRIVTVQHILPSLHQRLEWPERDVTINLVGVRGEIPRAFGKKKRKPLLDAVPEGKIVLGAELCEMTAAQPGDRLMVKGREFEVERCYEVRGNQDDVTAWINLGEAQRMFDKPNQINAILALECRCTADSTLPNIAKIRKDIAHILPGTRVVEFMSKVLTRAEARYEAVVTARETLASEKRHRAGVRAERLRAASTILPLVVVACILTVCLLMYANAKSRRHEIAVMRTIGWSTARVVALLVGKALLLGVVGGVVGSLVGVLIGLAGAKSSPEVQSWSGLVAPALLSGVVAVSAVLAALAAWLPALMASTANPAQVLQEE